MKTTQQFALSLAALATLTTFTTTAQIAVSAPVAKSSLSDKINEGWYVAPTLNVTQPDNRFIGSNATGLGLRFGKVLSPTWDLLLGASTTSKGGNALDYTQHAFSLDGLYFFSRETFRPFLSLGLGNEQNIISGINGKSNSSRFLAAGLGFQYQLADQVGLQGDFRHAYSLGSNSNFGFKNPTTNIATIGLSYYFDKPSPSPSALAAMAAAKAASDAQAAAAAARLASDSASAAAAKAAADAAAAAAKAAAAVAAKPKFEKVTLSANELFEFDRAVLKMPQPKLDEIAAAVLAYPGIMNLNVSGYTDRLGGVKYNQKLSERRADAVKTYLTGKGVMVSRINAAGKGKDSAVVECKQKKLSALIACLAPNRRVEVEPFTFDRPLK